MPQGQGKHLQPTEPDLIADARNWIAKWPEAVGVTNYQAAIHLADQHWAADCWYIFSDGLASDMGQVLDLLESRIQNGEKVPVIHTVGKCLCFFGTPNPFALRARDFLA